MALNTVGDIQNEVLVRLNRTTTDSFITDSILNTGMQVSHTWAAAYKKWPFTEGRSSTTYTTAIQDDNGDVLIDFPEGWKSDSVRYLEIGGKRLQKVQFQDYKRFREDNPSDLKKIYSDFNRRLYVNPNTQLSGTVWTYGQYTPFIDATDKTAITVFSNYEEDGNEAVVNKMCEYILMREREIGLGISRGKVFVGGLGGAYGQIADGILNSIWERYTDELAMYQQTDGEGMWKRISVVDGALRDDLFHRDRFF